MEASSSMTLPARDPGRIVAAAVSPAFEGLFRAEYARVVGIAHRVLADQAEAEDVAQDVFISFYRGHPADAAYARAWLHAAAAHAALNALRGRDRPSVRPRCSRSATPAFPTPRSPQRLTSARRASAPCSVARKMLSGGNCDERHRDRTSARNGRAPREHR